MKHTFITRNLLAMARQGQKTIVCLCIALCCAFALKAQVYQTHTSSGNDEVVKAEIVDGNGNIIHVGYDGFNGSGMSNAIIFSSLPAGNVNWYTRINALGGGAGGASEAVFNKVIVGQNGNYYAAGWARPTTGPGAGSFQAMVCEFDNLGNLVASNVRYNNIEMRYVDLCQLDNGYIAAVGLYTTNVQTNALVSLFDAGLNYAWSRNFPVNPQSRPEFTCVTHDGNMIIAAGRITAFSGCQGLLSFIDANVPLAPVHSGSWNYFLNVTNKIGAGTPLNGFYFTKLSLDGTSNRIIANGSLYDATGVTVAEDGAILEILNIPNSHPVTYCIQYGDPINMSSNSVRDGLSIISSTPGAYDYIVGLSPSNATFNSSTMPLLTPPPSTVLARITFPTTVSVSKITNPGNTIFSTYAVNNVLYGTGYESNAPISGAYDIFDQLADYNLTSPTAPPCVKDYHVNAITTQVIDIGILWPFLAMPTDPGVIQETHPQANFAKICGDDPPPSDGGCDHQCYWRVTGNNITMPKNIFGTLTPDPIRIFTSGAQTSQIEANGHIGIGFNSASTQLDVECIPPGLTPSGLRLQHLPDGDGRALVADANGFIYLAQSHLYKQGRDSEELEDRIHKLEEQINALSKLVSGNGNAVDGGSTLNVSPNPNDGKATATYSISGNFSKAAIRIVDNSGKIIQEIPVTAGSGSVNISIPGGTASNQLMCTLMADNKIMATQKILLLNK